LDQVGARYLVKDAGSNLAWVDLTATTTCDNSSGLSGDPATAAPASEAVADSATVPPAPEATADSATAVPAQEALADSTAAPGADSAAAIQAVTSLIAASVETGEQ
jgi:hypothetical protein